MKKLFAILLAVMLFASMATVASAASTTTLTTTVPAAAYTLIIPADREIPYGKTLMEIGNLDVTNEVGFADGKNLKITVNYTDFTCDNVSTTIPISISFGSHLMSGEFTEKEAIADGDYLMCEGESNGRVGAPKSANGSVGDLLAIKVQSADWGKALAGDYTATITFTAEVVAG